MRSVFAALLLLIAAGAQVALAKMRPAGAPALAAGTFAAFGALRAIAAEAVWFRADRLQDEGAWVELASLAKALTVSEPHTPEVWSYAAWNLAYNVSVMMPTFEDRWRWVHAAVRLLRDDGLRYNPTSPELHRELAWLFELKMGAKLDDASSVYRREWRKIVDDVACRGAWDELGMELACMEEIERRFGITDRADVRYSAIYWAWKGLPYARDEREQLLLAEIIRQAMLIYDRETSRLSTLGTHK